MRALAPILISTLLMSSPITVLAQPVEHLPHSGRNTTWLDLSVQGRATATPDIARIRAGILTSATDSQNALRANATQMQQVMQALKKSGIAARDIQTGSISLQPQYHYANNQPPELRGYQASNTLVLTVRNLDRLGDLIDQLASHGVNNIDGPTLLIDNPAPLYEQARQAALQQARQQAQRYADDLGLHVKRVVQLTESSDSPAAVTLETLKVSNSRATMDSTPVSAGEQAITIQLAMRFELSPTP